MATSTVRELLEFCALPLPAKKGLFERLEVIEEKLAELQEIDSRTRIALDPWATDFLISIGFFRVPESIPWDSLTEREDLRGVCERVEQLRPKRVDRYQPIQIRKSDETTGKLKRLLVTQPHAELQSVIARVLLQLSRRGEEV